MHVVSRIAAARALRPDLGRLALVPTMGALHDGHLSLVRAARNHAGAVAVSIFVNPTQFGPAEDFHKYPRPLEVDLDLCRQANVDLVFAPAVSDVYPSRVPPATVTVPDLAATLEGAHRPGHFAGVCQVVAKLFNILQPQVALFGEKDFQQLAVLRAMTAGLDFPIEIIGCPTLRDADGLAMSSRNRYLSLDQRRRALSINRSLLEIARFAASGERDVTALQARLHAGLNDTAGVTDVPTQLDYATIVDRVTLAEMTTLDRPAQGLVAMRVGTTRLIDNIAID